MHNKSTKTLIWIILGLAVVGFFLLEGNPITEKILNKTDQLLSEEFKQEIINSRPLRGPIDNNDSVLTQAGIVEWTNKWREDRGLSHLVVNEQLNTSAQLKAEDMANRQYFAHETPTGENVGYFAGEAGYEYILIGENLALGNFKDDKALVQAWMDSPGHRANILHDGYMEIGVGLFKGEYEGNNVWFAVQHFGKPRSACAEPDKALLSRIEENKKQLELWSIELEERKEELESTPRNHPSYNQKTREYNELVDMYNALTKETRTLVDRYNKEVQQFNACAQN